MAPAYVSFQNTKHLIRREPPLAYGKGVQSLSLVRFREHYSVMSYRLGWMGYQACQVCKEPIDDQLQTDTEYHFGFAYHFLCWHGHTNWGDRSLVPAEYKETSSPRPPLHASGPCIRLLFPTQTKCRYSRFLSLPPLVRVHTKPVWPYTGCCF